MVCYADPKYRTSTRVVFPLLLSRDTNNFASTRIMPARRAFANARRVLVLVCGNRLAVERLSAAFWRLEFCARCMPTPMRELLADARCISAFCSTCIAVDIGVSPSLMVLTCVTMAGMRARTDGSAGSLATIIMSFIHYTTILMIHTPMIAAFVTEWLCELPVYDSTTLTLGLALSDVQC